MTHRLTVLYHQPADPAAFDAHYTMVHAPLALQIPGLRDFDTSRPEPGPGGAPAAFYLVATLGFADQETFDAGLSSPEGRAAVDDLGNFATGGVTIVSGAVETLL